MNRVLVLSDKFGVECDEVVNFTIGGEYDLRYPVEVKDKVSGETKEMVTKITFDRMPTRADQRVWKEIKDDFDRTGKMLVDLTNLKDVHLDFLTPIDSDNLDLLLSAFLPERFMRIATES